MVSELNTGVKPDGLWLESSPIPPDIFLYKTCTWFFIGDKPCGREALGWTLWTTPLTTTRLWDRDFTCYAISQPYTPVARTHTGARAHTADDSELFSPSDWWSDGKWFFTSTPSSWLQSWSWQTGMDVISLFLNNRKHEALIYPLQHLYPLTWNQRYPLCSNW